MGRGGSTGPTARTPAWAAVMAVVAVAAGCRGEDPDATSETAATTVATDHVVECADLLERAMGPRATCRRVTVPLRHEGQGGETVELAVVELRAQPVFGAAEVGPVVFLAGGPGQASTDFVEALGRSLFPIVFVDARGTGHSSPSLDCPEVDGAVSDRLRASSERAATMEGEAIAACVDRLAADGVDLDAYTTADNVEDLEVVRRTLGIDRWNVWGGSYGATLAVELVRAHPASVRAAVVDSALPSDVDILAAWPDVRRDRLDALFARCDGDGACGAGDLGRTWSELVTALDAAPVPVDVRGVDAAGDAMDLTVLMDGRRVVLGSVSALAADPIGGLPSALWAAADGDLAPLAEFLVPRDAFSFAEAMHWAVGCRDGWSASTAGADAGAAVDSSSTAWFDMAWVRHRCEQLGFDVRARSPARAPVDVPVLVLAGEFDPNLAADWPDRIAEQLGNASVIRIAGAGHTVGFTSCGRTLIDEFLADPATAPDDRCVGTVATVGDG